MAFLALAALIACGESEPPSPRPGATGERARSFSYATEYADLYGDPCYDWNLLDHEEVRLSLGEPPVWNWHDMVTQEVRIDEQESGELLRRLSVNYIGGDGFALLLECGADGIYLHASGWGYGYYTNSHDSYTTFDPPILLWPFKSEPGDAWMYSSTASVTEWDWGGYEFPVTVHRQEVAGWLAVGRERRLLTNEGFLRVFPLETSPVGPGDSLLCRWDRALIAPGAGPVAWESDGAYGYVYGKWLYRGYFD